MQGVVLVVAAASDSGFEDSAEGRLKCNGGRVHLGLDEGWNIAEV